MGDLQEAYFDNGTDYYKKLNKIAYDPKNIEEYYEKTKALQDETAKRDDELIKKMNNLREQKPVEIMDISKFEAENAQIIQKFDALGIKIKEEKITPGMDTSTVILQLDGIEYSYKDLKNRIESNPIQIKIQQEGGGGGTSSGGGGYPSLSPSPEVTGRPTWASDVEVNTNFTATGLSPKIFLGSAFDKIESRFKTISEKSQAMEAVIEFQEYSNQLRELQKKYDLITEAAESWIQTMRKYSYMINRS